MRAFMGQVATDNNKHMERLQVHCGGGGEDVLGVHERAHRHSAVHRTIVQSLFSLVRYSRTCLQMGTAVECAKI